MEKGIGISRVTSGVVKVNSKTLFTVFSHKTTMGLQTRAADLKQARRSCHIIYRKGT